ncbi:myosin phosphatase Rho-interacting protein-like [Lampris incognitus]|uniref:myosin phosphatase Rho-interacting protein-like n=1 Tax=Lampris incognitus TaxID=2546036 RepID=UPI0024B4F335|nr:myosin phosphatase Rho-interacting protein-like [Lampris incognitus]
MSGDKAATPCNKFQANIFNKSKCQNCFKSRELHLLTDHDMEQAKPIYGGWLCLAPEGTDFDKPMQRSRKWQRRFFILYEYGSLSFALDELPSTLPQGTVNMNLCTEVIDAEPRTGQRNSLCIVTPELEIFIRGESKDIINGWNEQLGQYPRINKQNQNKKRKVERVTTQEPSPAKMAVTEPCFSATERGGEPGCSLWQQKQSGRGADLNPTWTVTDTHPLGPNQHPAGGFHPAEDGWFADHFSSLASVCSGSADPGSAGQPAGTEPNGIHTSTSIKSQWEDTCHRNLSERPTGPETAISGEAGEEQEGGQALSRKGRSEARASKREKLLSLGDMVQLAAPPPQRRAKSLDRRTSDSIMTPDLLNFKKGWMVKLDKEDKWRKYWFVLSADSLRYYKDSIAEEASDLQGEIDLTKCHNVSEYQVHRNYGFQIHTQKGIYTLSAMTSGIRRNWIQALMKNIHPPNAPDVASLPGHHVSNSSQEYLPKPDVTQDSPFTEAPGEIPQTPKPMSVLERRQEGRYQTFDWAEFWPLTKPMPELDVQKTKGPWLLELGDLERKQRREERRRRYESMLGFPLTCEAMRDHDREADSARETEPWLQQEVEEEIEKYWQQVEKTGFRLEKTVPLYAKDQAKDTAELERLLDGYKKGVEDLKERLAESVHRRLELESQLRAMQQHQQQVCPLLNSPLNSEDEFGQLRTNDKTANSPTQSLTDMYKETRELLQQQNLIRQSMQEQLVLSMSTPQISPGSQTLPSIWLHGATEDDLRDLGGLLPYCPVTENAPLPSPVSDRQQHSPVQKEGELEGTNLDSPTPIHQAQTDSEVHQLVPTLATQINGSEGSTGLQIMEATGDRIADSQSCYIGEKISLDMATVKRLSQEVEMLTSQNEALNQRNQEMLNQLTEADWEIEGLKAELVSRYCEPQHQQHLPEVEHLSNTRVESLDIELNRRNQELLEAQSLIASLERRLRDTETRLQLKEASLRDLAIPTDSKEVGEETDTWPSEDKPDEYLRCFEATEAKLTELERQLCKSEQTCRALQTQDKELKEVERLYSQRSTESVNDTGGPKEELENKKLTGETLLVGNVSLSDEERIQEVVEGMIMRLKTLRKLMEVIDRSDFGVMKRSLVSEHKVEKLTLVGQLKWEEQFWGALLNGLKVSPSQLNEEKLVEDLLSEMALHMVIEKQMLLLAHDLLSETYLCTDFGSGGPGRICENKPLEGLDVIWNLASGTESENVESDDNCGILQLNNQHRDRGESNRKFFSDITLMKMSLLSHTASSIGASSNDKLQFMACKLWDFHISGHSWIDFIYSAVTEAFYCHHTSMLHSVYQRDLEETKQSLLTSSLTCRNCAGLMNENEELRARLSTLERQRKSSVSAEMPTANQTDAIYLQNRDCELENRTDRQIADTTPAGVVDEIEEETLEQNSTAKDNGQKLEMAEEMVEGDSLPNVMEIPVLNAMGLSGIPDEVSGENTASVDVSKDADVNTELEEVVLLRGRVKALEEQLSVVTQEMEAELHGKMGSLQLEHGRELDKLKAACEFGFDTMSKSHQRFLEEVQRRHQLELEHLMKERDRLLEEETAATATAIEAIKNAYRLELEREVQRICLSENSAGMADLEEICQQHREELSSCQRELEVLSQQYSLKCLENGHLAQALDAERKALFQCQQENQDLRTRDQELSGHLAAEITRLCSRAKQDAPHISQGMDVYEMEITLRVKESEVQCLKQEATSLKDELRSAQRDKRNATQKYKDIYTELSVTRAKAERDVDQLRENLMLARKALGEPSP